MEGLLFKDIIDFELICVKSIYNCPFQFTYNLNKYCNYSFYRIHDLDILFDNNIYYFTAFNWIDETNKIEAYIIYNFSNKADFFEEHNINNLFDNKILISSCYDCNFIFKICNFPVKLENEIEHLSFITKVKSDSSLFIESYNKLVF